MISGKTTHASYYPRPKQCTEKCFKPGGECIYPTEKCSGKVDCLYAEDELNCSHPIQRSHEEQQSPASSSYWPSSYMTKTQPVYYTAPQVISRSRPNTTPSYYPGLPQQGIQYPAQSSQQPLYPAPVAIGRAHQVHQVAANCEADTEFQCVTRNHFTHLASCIPESMQCDRILQCTDKSDEMNCLALTSNFREPLTPSSIAQM